MKIEHPAVFAPRHPIPPDVRPDPNNDPSRRRYSEVASAEALELADFMGNVALTGYDFRARYWHAHLYYARQAAMQLARGELFPAQRAASIAAYSLTLYRQHGGAVPTGPLSGTQGSP